MKISISITKELHRKLKTAYPLHGEISKAVRELIENMLEERKDAVRGTDKETDRGYDR